MPRNLISWIRVIGMIEGVSFVLLLAVAMPLKYIWDMPVMVWYVGRIHGGLFLAYVALIGVAYFSDRLDRKLSLLALLASVVPFGPFVIDRRLKSVE